MRVWVSIAEPVSSLFIIGFHLLQCLHDETCETQERYCAGLLYWVRFPAGLLVLGCRGEREPHRELCYVSEAGGYTYEQRRLTYTRYRRYCRFANGSNVSHTSVDGTGPSRRRVSESMDKAVE